MSSGFGIVVSFVMLQLLMRVEVICQTENNLYVAIKEFLGLTMIEIDDNLAQFIINAFDNRKQS
jgi:hypothetical protein